MASTATGSAEPFQIGRVISRTFNAIGGNFLNFVILSAVAVSPLVVFGFLAPTMRAQSATAATDLFNSPQLLSLYFAIILVYVVFNYVLQAALAHGTIVYLSGRKASFGDCLATGLRDFFPIFGIAVLVGLGFVLGFILLVVPGIMLAMRWSVAVPARVAEGPGILQAMGRSAELTRGHRWAILGTLIVLGLIGFALQLVITPANAVLLTVAGAQASSAISVISILISAIPSIAIAMINSAGIASTYFELRTIKEGVGAEEIAKVFA